MYRCGIVKLNSRARFSTVCLHAGQEPDPSTGAIITPIYQTSTYVQEALGKHKGYEYAPTQNPTPIPPDPNLTPHPAASADLAQRRGVKPDCDNPLASPYIQRPIEFGAEIVTHSTTKYLNGHSDSVGGIVVAVRDEDIEWLTFVQNAEGAILGPFDSWLVLR